MNIPDEVWQRVLMPGSHVALRVALALYSNGSARVNTNGDRVNYWKGTRLQLAKLAGLQGVRGTDAAIDELVDAGLLQVHNATKPNAARGYAIAMAVKRGANFAPPSESAAAHHDHDDGSVAPIPSSQHRPEDEAADPSSFDPRLEEQLLHLLAALGVTSPYLFTKQYGLENCRDGLVYVRHLNPPPRNPGALLRSLLERGKVFPKAGNHQLEPPDSLAYRRGAYTGAPEPASVDLEERKRRYGVPATR